jgi:hypothetical protein
MKKYIHKEKHDFVAVISTDLLLHFIFSEKKKDFIWTQTEIFFFPTQKNGSSCEYYVKRKQKIWRQRTDNFDLVKYVL